MDAIASDIPIRAIGADVRSLRKSRGLTLEALSSALGKSVGWLSQVERDLSHLTADDIAALSVALSAPKSLFTSANPVETEEGRVVRKNRRRTIGERVPGLIEDLVSPDLTDEFEVIHSTFEPGTSSAGEVNRDTTEVGYLISGRLDIWIGGDAFTLDPGDSFRIRDDSLRWANPYSTQAVALWVISPPVY